MVFTITLAPTATPKEDGSWPDCDCFTREPSNAAVVTWSLTSLASPKLNLPSSSNKCMLSSAMSVFFLERAALALPELTLILPAFKVELPFTVELVVPFML